MTDWRAIPGYDGMYEINVLGEVRTWRWRKEHRMKEPRLLTPYMRHRGNGPEGRKRFVKLTDADGNTAEPTVLSLMVEVWCGGKRPGMVPYHKNRDLSDNALHNIGFATPEKLGKMTGAMATRKPVVKIDRNGEVVACYTSARAAGRANHMSYQTVLDRCNGKVKNPFALDGYNYQFDE